MKILKLPTIVGITSGGRTSNSLNLILEYIINDCIELQLDPCYYK